MRSSDSTSGISEHAVTVDADGSLRFAMALDRMSGSGATNRSPASQQLGDMSRVRCSNEYWHGLDVGKACDEETGRPYTALECAVLP